jgi:hypothetical protein
MQRLRFLGFEVVDVIVAAGSQGPDDLKTQADLLERAKAAGASLAGPAPVK